MKRLLLILLPLLLIVGCSKPVEDSTLIKKDGLMYSPNSDKPYTGEVFINYSTGEKLYQGTYENGLLVQDSYLNKDGSVKEPINYETTLIERDRVFYTKDTNKPYSGPVFSLDKKGLNKRESILEDGKMITYTDFRWYENGQKEIEIPFKNGKEDGLGTQWYENGQKKFEGTFKDGKEDGLFTEWYENGQKKEETTYKDGKEDGLGTQWYENGQKEKETTFKDGRLDGLWTQWYENGQKEKETTYKDGKLDGLGTEYSENGQKVSEGTYKEGDMEGSFTFWYENGKKKEEGTYKEKNKEGLWTKWYKNGNKQSESNFNNGRIEGSGEYWSTSGKEYVGKIKVFSNGLLKEVINKNGESVSFYNDGQISWIGNYKNGKQNGKWLYYEPSGKLYLESNYENGNLID